MSKIDITSREWCDIIFDGKNKKYGAYKIRTESTHRYMVVLLILLASVLLPLLFISLSIVFTSNKSKVIDVVQLSDMKPAENKYRLAVQSMGLAPQMRKSIIDHAKSDVPVIKLDKDVNDADQISQSKDGQGVNISVAGVPADTTGFSNKTTLHNAVNANENKPVFRIIEQLPEYPGGATAFMKWLTKNLKYPIAEQQQKVAGKVVVQFIVNKNGSISDIKIIQSLNEECDKEVIRVLNMMPKWKPGTEKGKPVRTKCVIPIIFKMV